MRIAKIAAVGLSLAAGAAAALLAPSAGAARGSHDDGAAAAAGAFLKSLSPELRSAASFPVDSPERLKWNFIPIDRVGVSLLKLDDAQSEFLGPLLATALSPEGLLAARGVMKHENILRRVETEAGAANASRRDPGLYYTAIFGKPSESAPWAWRFEGHHLSVNVTELPGQAPVVAPVFMGANPAKVLTGPNAGFRLLAAEEDLGRELIKLLPAERRKAAMIQDTAFSEILTKNDPKVQPLELAGLAAADMSADERAQLRRLIELYVGRVMHSAAADALVRLDRAGFDKVRFAWAGGIEPGQAHYYRIHGPTLLIEYDDTQGNANHIHTVYRDLQRDFGGDVLRAHYRSDPTHPSMVSIGKSE
ncbi:MAG TPA: DUF3500 domain-containing protein [Steroidobacteraceae bacterium]|jgi:hypothetical protein|nr:DUF3500 domain-containing protein [Steroidobacteraceae bacterium]